IEEVARGRLWQHQRVAARLRKQIHHHEDGVVLEHSGVRDLAFQDPGKDVGGIILRHWAAPISWVRLVLLAAVWSAIVSSMTSTARLLPSSSLSRSATSFAARA